MHELDEIALQILVLAGAPANRTDLDVGVIGVGVLHLVVHAGGEAEEGGLAGPRVERHLLELMPRERRVVVADVERMRVLQRAMSAVLPGLQMLEAGLEVTALRIPQLLPELAQSHRLAQIAGDQRHRVRLRRDERGVDVEPRIRIARHRAIEDRLGRELKVLHASRRYRSDRLRQRDRRRARADGHPQKAEHETGDRSANCARRGQQRGNLQAHRTLTPRAAQKNTRISRISRISTSRAAGGRGG